MIAPTLLVGLGGTGSKIVCRVSQMVTEEQRKRIGFAVFDTDINELREIREANPFIKTIQTSTKLTVGEYLNIDTHARDDWTQRSVREIWSLCIMQSRNFTSWRAIPQNRH